jgi:hypothetical protein
MVILEAQNCSMHDPAPVNDTLLKKLSLETQLIGKLVILKGWEGGPERQAMISNVIILPFTDFYRKLFMKYYALYKHNAVKALKELIHYFPNTAEYGLDTAYVLRSADSIDAEPEITHRGDFVLLEDIAGRRQEIFTGRLKTLKYDPS